MKNLLCKPKLERNQGVDLLRNLSMFMVVMLHVLGAGGILAATQGQAVKTASLMVLHITAMCSVNCYGLISGYVGYRSKWRISNIFALWLQVLLYSVGIGALLFVLMPDTVSLKDLVKCCLPVLFQRYWYFTAFFALFFTMPLLNAAIDRIDRRQLEISFGILLFFLTFYQNVIVVSDVFGTNSGYSYVWLVVLYCIGAYLGKYDVKFKKPTTPLVSTIGCIAVCLLFRVLTKLLNLGADGRLEAYNSPIMLLMGIMMLLWFANMKLPGWLAKTAAFLAPASFGVYLIHAHPIILNKILKDAFVKMAGYPIWILIPLVIAVVVGIYAVCTAVDLVRHYLFKAINVKGLLSKLENKLFPNNGGNQ